VNRAALLRALRFALPGLGILLVLGLSTLLWLRVALNPVSADETPMVFEVPRGATLGSVARSLKQAGLVRNERALVWWTRWRGWENDLRAGYYELSPSLGARAVVKRLVSGRVRTSPVSFPEGWTAVEIAAHLEATGLADAGEFLALVNDAKFARSLGVPADRLEGYLFPETYRLTRGLPPEAIARIMVKQFHSVWKRVAPLAKKRGLRMHDLVTLASIVEKETGVARERPVIAAVFHNRLAIGKKLETDPSVIYGIPNFDGNLRRWHLEDESNPYNTYQFPGLPPGPIANPGEAAMRAAAQPAKSDYLYFVSRRNGSHWFSRTFEEHESAVLHYQRLRRRGPPPPPPPKPDPEPEEAEEGELSEGEAGEAGEAAGAESAAAEAAAPATPETPPAAPVAPAAPEAPVEEAAPEAEAGAQP